MTRPPIALAVAIMSGFFFLASIASAADHAPTDGTSKPLDLSDKGAPDPRLEGAWKLVAVDDNPVPKAGRRWPNAFIVRFEAGQVTGMNACNGFFGPYRVVGSRLQTALGETTLGCKSPVPDQWDSALMALASGGHIEVSPDGSKLTLSAADAGVHHFTRQ